MGDTSAVAELVAEKRKLKKSLFRWDMIFFTVCAIVAMDTIGASAAGGPQSLFWLLVSAITFLIPYGLITAELGAAFPTEGATYDWVRLAYGHFAGAVVGVLYWLSNPIWLGGTLTGVAIAAMDSLWGTSLGNNKFPEMIVAFLFIWVAVGMNILSLRYMKWVPNLGAIVRLLLIALFAVVAIGNAISGGAKGSLSGMVPPLDSNFTFVLIGVLSVIVFQWIGFELQTNASEEMENPQRDIPRAVYLSGLISFLGYAIPIAGIILTLSSDKLSSVGGFVTAYQAAVSASLGGAAQFFDYIVGAAFVFVLLSSGTTWLMGSDRLMAIGALAGSGPQQLGYFSARFGTPIVVNVLSGIIATFFMVLALTLTSGNLANFFLVVLGLVISTTTFSYILIFPALITLRRKYPNVKRPFVVPGGNTGAWVCVILAVFWVAAATLFSLWPGLFTYQWDADHAGLSRASFELANAVAIGALIVVAIVFWAVGRGHAIHTGPVTAAGTAMPAAAPSGE
ncbi:MAG TPA: APC family permease [Candidatus Dormibacteraeota bacterium]|nr:APC family permease [Candidatus Dormibacteraeota bacterium]